MEEVLESIIWSYSECWSWVNCASEPIASTNESSTKITNEVDLRRGMVETHSGNINFRLKNTGRLIGRGYGSEYNPLILEDTVIRSQPSFNHANQLIKMDNYTYEYQNTLGVRWEFSHIYGLNDPVIIDEVEVLILPHKT